jgi:NAD(P)-dependent dehydrogenase (short-subunit alcohol dehydrogenase family)
MGRLQGKSAIVLGAAGKDNIGQHIARRFTAEGATVVVAGRRLEPLRRLADEIGGHAAVCDITSKADNLALAAFTREKLGAVDIGVNCTGWGYLSPFLDSTEEDIDRIMDLQFKGPFFFYQAMIGAMEHGGSIIQISSATATIMLNNHAAYMGTKAGADHVIRCVANEFGERGIRANSISPGATDSPMTNLAERPWAEKVFADCYPLGRVGTSDDIAAAAVWLASDECFMTGQNLQVNGGLTLRRNPWAHELAAAAAAAAAR